MKKRVLLLLCVCLCAMLLCSCATLMQPINQASAESKLEKIEQECVTKEYEVRRLDESEMNSVIESIVAAEGIVLKGPAVGMLMYTYEEQESYVVATVIAMSSAKDAETLADAMKRMTDDADNESLSVEITRSGMIVTMLQIYG
ncbi:MAG: hypothetical protein E7594_01600 [Ruminococcaceae bacterium]|nr:hypothetical protein [Oscillospiraceae bacterium]